ncbi:MAG: ATP-binding protein [Candidatus Eisenbacteria bacterium]
MSRRLVLFVGSVVALAIVLLALHPLDWSRTLLVHWLAWVAITVVAESLWLPTITGEGTDSMASAANFATAVLWGVVPAIWIVALSTAIADLVIRRRPPIRILFNTAAMILVMAAAGWTFVLLGGPAEGIWSRIQLAPRLEVREMSGLLIPLLGLGLVYRGLNIGLVAVASGWGSERRIRLVLREDFLYAEQLISDLALLFLSPLMVVSYAMLSWAGIILFYVPLLVIRDSHRRYVELKKAQDQLIHTERMAAKGEIAAEIGHEISNYLAAISARAQMLTLELGKAEPEKVARHARIIMEQASNMAILTKGLMDFSHKQMKIVRVDVNDLLRRTVDFVQPQNKFDQVEFDLQLNDSLPPITADPGQLQQVFINLFQNAAEAMSEKAISQKRIVVSTGWQEPNEIVLVKVADNGPGMSRAVAAKIFDPTFTTKPTGHGFGLATCYRIAVAHRGRIWVDSEAGRGAVFSMTLPVGGQAGW